MGSTSGIRFLSRQESEKFVKPYPREKKFSLQKDKILMSSD